MYYNIKEHQANSVANTKTMGNNKSNEMIQIHDKKTNMDHGAHSTIVLSEWAELVSSIPRINKNRVINIDGESLSVAQVVAVARYERAALSTMGAR